MTAPRLVLDDPDAQLWHGDALACLRELPDESVHLCVTSPPFFGLRSYLPDGHPDKPAEVGLEDSPDAWAERLVAVFREVRRVLRRDGSFWCEVGDGYASSSTYNTTNSLHSAAGWKQDSERRPNTRASGDLKPKDLVGAPWLLAQMMRDPYYTGRIADERDRIWLAAIIDGEGCIHIHRRKAGDDSGAKWTRKDGTTVSYARTQDTYGPMVHIANTSDAIISRVSALTGVGSRNLSQRGRNQPLHRWSAVGNQARDLLREVYPYLVAKQHEARIALGSPSSGDLAASAHVAIKALHAGRSVDLDFPPPPSMFEPGWYLRGAYPWRKANAMPESVRDRFTVCSSTVFQFAKSGKPTFWLNDMRPGLPGSRTRPAPDYWWHPPAGEPGDPSQVEVDGWKRRNAWRGHDYFFDGVAVQEPAAWERWGDQTVPKHEGTPTASGWVPPRGVHEFTRSRERRESENGVRGYASGTPNFSHDGMKWPRGWFDIPTEPNGLALCEVCGAYWERGAPAEHCGQRVVAHYAAFPEKLVERIIRCGTSERGVCGECGAPWVREVEESLIRSPVHGAGSVVRGRGETTDVNGWAGEAMPRLNRQRTTLGWRPSCDHDAPTVPATVLDPFAGSGTTMLAARRLGRHSVGIELREAYARMTVKRLERWHVRGFTAAPDVHDAQTALEV